MAKSFAQIISYQYKRSDDNFTNDCVTFFTENNKLGKKYLINKDIDTFIDKITKGKKTKSLMSYYKNDVNERIKIITLLTKYHMLSYRNVNNIINCVNDLNITEFDWIMKSDDLTSSAISFLIKKGYVPKNPIDGLNKIEPTITIDDINLAISNAYHIDDFYNSDDVYLTDDNQKNGKINVSNGDAISGQIIEIIEKKNLKPNLETITKLCDECEDISVIEKCMKCDVEYDIKIFEKIMELDCSLSTVKSYISKLFETKFIKNMSEIIFVFDNITTKNFEIIMNFIDEFNIPYSIDALHKIVSRSKNIDDNNSDGSDDSEYDVIDVKKNTTIKNLIMKFLDKEFSKQEWTTLLEQICSKCDEIFFDFLIQNIQCVNEQCLVNACESNSVFIINKLLNMKIFPTINCFAKLSNNYDEIFNILVSNGLQVTDELIKISIKNEFYISELEQYGYEISEKTYEICHELQKYPQVYLDQMSHIQNVKIYEAIRNRITTTITEEEIIELIESKNITPNRIMYELVLVDYDKKLVDYFEKKHNMKPTINSVIKIVNYDDRLDCITRHNLF